MRLTLTLSLVLALACAACTGSPPDREAIRPDGGAGDNSESLAPRPSETELADASERATACGSAFTRTHDRSALEKRLGVRLARMLRGAGMKSLGGDHPWFDASAAFRNPPVGVRLFPRELACSAPRLRAATEAVVNGIPAQVGGLYGSHGARFECEGVVHEVHGDRRADVRSVLEALTGAISACH